MAVATYATDLTTFDLAEGVAWAEATASGWTSVFAITTGETDDFIQGTQCNSTTVKTGVGALLANFGSGITLGQDHAVLVWAKWDVYPSLDTEANGGIRTVLGSSLLDFNGFKHLGSDSYIYDGWINLATGDPADATVTPDYVVGTPTTTKQYAGWAFNALSVPSKGNPYKVDAIRYGRCEIYAINGQAGAYGTFLNMAQKNDYNDATNGYNRWGLFRKTGTSSFLHKGLMSFGQTATACDFRDSNKSIAIANTKHVTPAFNKYEVNNAASNVDLTSISISALGTKSKGRWENKANAVVAKKTCTFTDMDTFIYMSNTVVTNTVYRRCGIVTAGDATFTSCIFDNASGLSALVMSPTNAAFLKLTDCSFASSGTGYAVDASGTLINTDISINWDCDSSGYALQAGTATNRTIKVNVNTGSTLTISVAAGRAAPTYNNIGGGTVNVVSGTVVLRITVTDTDAVPIQNSRVEIRATETVGTVTTGDVLLTGLTNASGIIENTAYAYEGAFNPTGLNISIKARQGSVSPYKVPSTTTGTILDTTGYQAVIALQSDE